MITDWHIDMDNAGEVVTSCAFDKATGLAEEFCLPAHPTYAAWCKQAIAAGYEIRELTINEVLDHLDATRKAP